MLSLISLCDREPLRNIIILPSTEIQRIPISRRDVLEYREGVTPAWRWSMLADENPLDVLPAVAGLLYQLEVE